MRYRLKVVSVERSHVKLQKPPFDKQGKVGIDVKMGPLTQVDQAFFEGKLGQEVTLIVEE